MRKVAVVLVAAALLWPISGCFLFDHRREAEQIRRQIRALPGVTDTNLTYANNITGEHFALTVTLDRAITVPQAVDVGRTFTEQRRRQGLGDYNGDLMLYYPARGTLPRNVNTDDRSVALFDFGPSDGKPDPDADAVADGVAIWLRTAHSPVAELVGLDQPAERDDAASRDIDVTLTPDATAATAAALQRSDPALADASWEIKLVFNEYGDTRNYVSTPTPPSDADRALWSDISGVIGKYYRAKGSTAPPRPGAQAETQLEIDIGQGRGNDVETQRIVPAVAALLPRFGHPAALLVWGYDGPIEIVVGGCYRHQPDHTRLPLEIELSRQYETC
ncbi:hypothetical protein [Mycobacterium talmoniae]|uniref:Uncharacterized protein n=1 Tax=Mycobacterium talmoniae TaxID=1858794 RepID=A0A1S1NMP9_9MYCO|nr:MULTISPECIES: hypothetical protein [Mycobacterium]OHV06049.1 hypothetical protein BKN37_03600 [Mycobacterium talmoniae]PQM47211.1 hypothetical protein C1Y40_02605 [Mycobacterium talmoniae]TDH49917.1 hypothetical protein E2F47_19210 [Mycobacterium eburneum]